MKTDLKLVVCRVLTAIAFVLAGILLVSCADDWQKAEKAAQQYVRKLPNATGDVECAHKDSDQDGYCSCSAFMKDGSVTPLDCGCEIHCFNCAEGCKLQPVKVYTPKADR